MKSLAETSRIRKAILQHHDAGFTLSKRAYTSIRSFLLALILLLLTQLKQASSSYSPYLTPDTINDQACPQPKQYPAVVSDTTENYNITLNQIDAFQSQLVGVGHGVNLSSNHKYPALFWRYQIGQFVSHHFSILDYFGFSLMQVSLGRPSTSFGSEPTKFVTYAQSVTSIAADDTVMVVKLSGASVDVIQHVRIYNWNQRLGKTHRLLLLDEKSTTSNHIVYVMTKESGQNRFQILGFDQDGDVVLEFQNQGSGHPIALEFAKNKDALYAVYIKKESVYYIMKIQPFDLINRGPLSQNFAVNINFESLSEYKMAITDSYYSQDSNTHDCAVLYQFSILPWVVISIFKFSDSSHQLQQQQTVYYGLLGATYNSETVVALNHRGTAIVWATYNGTQIFLYTMQVPSGQVQMENVYNYLSINQVLLGKFFKRDIYANSYLLWPDNNDDNLKIYNTESFLSCATSLPFGMSSTNFIQDFYIHTTTDVDFTHLNIQINNAYQQLSSLQTEMTPFAQCTANEFLTINMIKKTIDVIQGQTLSENLTFTVDQQCTHVNPQYSFPIKQLRTLIKSPQSYPTTSITHQTTENMLTLSVKNQQGWYQETTYEESIYLECTDQTETIFDIKIRLLPIFTPKIAAIVLQSGQTGNLNLKMESNNHTKLALAESFTPNLGVSIVIDAQNSSMIKLMSNQPGFHNLSLTLYLPASATGTFAPPTSSLTSFWALLLTYPLPPLIIELRGPQLVTYALPKIAGINLGDQNQFKFAAPPGLMEIIGWHASNRTFIFRPNMNVPQGEFVVDAEITHPEFTNDKALMNFTVTVQDTLIICGPSILFPRPTVDLAYDIGSPGLTIPLSSYFPYELEVCKPELSLAPDPASATLDTTLITMKDSTLQVESGDARKVLRSPYRVRVSAKWPGGPETSQVFKVRVSQQLVNQQLKNGKAATPMGQQVFTGKISDIKFADVVVEVMSADDAPEQIELPSQYFSSENLQAEVRLKQTSGFMTQRNGILYSRAKQSEIGIYTEIVAVTLNGDLTQTRNVPFRIRVLPRSRNVTCPFGSRPNDCLPKIQSILDSGLLTVFFPIPLSSVVNETLYRNVSSTLDIRLVQQVQANTSITSWDLVRLTTTELELQLFIINPLYVSFLSEELDKVTVVMLDPSQYFLVEDSAYLIKDNYTMVDSIPPQKINSTLMRIVEKTFSIIDSGMTSGLMVNLVLAMLISAPMKMMWGVINTMQIITYMNWMNMKMPQNVVVCLKTIHDISNLSIVPKDLTEKVLQVIAGLKKKVLENGKEDPDSSVKKIMQIGLIFVAAIIGLLFVGILYFLQKRFSLITKVYVLLRDKLMWGAFITFFIKSYLKLYVSSALGVQEENKTQTERLVPFIMLLVLSVAPLFMLTGLVNISSSFDKLEIKQKYGALTVNLRTDSAPAYLYNWFFVLRRMIYGLSLAFLGSNPSVQLSLQIILSLGNLLYVQQQLPYFEKWDNYLEMFNEVTILLFLTSSVSYADRSPSPEAASDWGFLQIGLLACNLAFNLSIFLYTLGKLLITNILDYLRHFRKRFVPAAQLKTVKIQQQLHSHQPDLFHPSLSLDELKAIDLTNHPHSIDHQSEQHEESKDDWAGVSEQQDEYDLEEEEDIQEISSQEENVWEDDEEEEDISEEEAYADSLRFSELSKQ